MAHCFVMGVQIKILDEIGWLTSLIRKRPAICRSIRFQLVGPRELRSLAPTVLRSFKGWAKVYFPIMEN